MKKFTSPCDSGYPGSDLCNISVQPDFKVPCQITNLDQDASFNKEQESSLHSNIYSSITNTHKGVSNICLPLHLVNMQTNTKLKSSSNSLEVSSNSVPQSPLSINTCECWLLEKPSDNDRKSDRKQSFGIPPLKLGSLIDDSNTTGDEPYGSDTTYVSENENILDSCTLYDESAISSQQDASEDFISSSLTPMNEENFDNQAYPINYYNASKNVSVNKQTLKDTVSSQDIAADIYVKQVLLPLQNHSPQPSVVNASYTSAQTYVKTSKKMSKSQTRKPEYSLPSTPTSYRNITRSKMLKLQPKVKHDNINDSIEPTATASTSYLSLEPHRNIIDNCNVEQTNNQNCKVKSHVKESYIQCGCRSQADKEKSKSEITHTHCSTSKQVQCSPHSNKYYNSTHCNKQSDTSKKRILGIALRVLLIHFLNNTEKCNRDSCICSKLMNHNVSFVNTQTQTDETLQSHAPQDLQDATSSRIKSKISAVLNSKKKYVVTKTKNSKDLKPESCENRKGIKKELGNICSGDKIAHSESELQYSQNDKDDLTCKTSVGDKYAKEKRILNEESCEMKFQSR